MKKLLAPVVFIVAFFAFGVGSASAQCTWTISEQRGGTTCYEDGTVNSCLQHNATSTSDAITLDVNVTGVELGNEPFTGDARLVIDQHTGGGETNAAAEFDAGEGTFIVPLNDNQSPTQWTFNLQINTSSGGRGRNYQDVPRCSFTFETQHNCPADSCVTEEREIITDIDDSFTLCEQLPVGTPERNACEACAEGPDDQAGVWTAIGCINREPTSILGTLLEVGLTVGGGIALLMILGAGFIFSTSSGDPKRVDQAKELITSALVGLIFIIFSVAILQYIGFTVLKIPGFGG